MPNAQQVDLIRKGAQVWNAWRKEHSNIWVDLTQSDLTGVDLYGARLEHASLGGANLRNADLRSAQMPDAWLVEADMQDARLDCANLRGCCLYKADLTNADLRKASLYEADLRYAILTGANLDNALLEHARLVGTDLRGANLNGCGVYGISAWDLRLNDQTRQLNLVITPRDQPTITVDNLKVAQFVYLILNNAEIRGVIDTITSKAVLILGRFSPERKTVLESVRAAIRECGYAPILFDFNPSARRDLTETIQLLANIVKFVVADLTDAKSIPQELAAIVPTLPSVPVQPILLASQREYAMFEHWQIFPWVLPVFEYNDLDHLMANVHELVIKRAEGHLQRLRALKLSSQKQVTNPSC